MYESETTGTCSMLILLHPMCGLTPLVHQTIVNVFLPPCNEFAGFKY